MLERDIGRADALVAAGSTGEALALAAALVADHPADPAPYRLAARALFAANPAEGLAALPADRRARLLRALLLQPDCPARPWLFHQAVADRITGHVGGVDRLVAALEPMLRSLARPDPPLPLLLFLLVVRPHLGRWMPPRRLSALHLAAFPAFSADDLALPYSAMFHPHAFGRNRADLVRAVRREGPAFLARLEPHHLTLVAWSTGHTQAAADAARPAASADDADRRSARSLALAADGPADTPAVAEQAAALAAARAALAEAATGGARWRPARLGWRPAQAAAAARSIAATRVPFLRRGDRRVRVAVCVSGQLRGYRRALPTWRASLFAHADVRFFVHSWARIGRGPAHPWRAVLPFAGDRFGEAYRRLGQGEGMAALEARYPTLFAALDAGGGVTTDALRELYGTPHVVVDDETDPRFAGWSNQRKMHEKIAAAHALAVGSGEGFDLVVRLRPDLSLRTQAFGWADLHAAARAGPRLWTDGAFGVHHGVPMLGDQFAVGAPAPMARYADTATLYPRLAALDLAGAPAALEGHVSLAQVCWLHGIAVARAPIRFGRLLEPAPFETPEILQALEADAAGRHDAIDQALIAAARADLPL